jgi:hypothetical protein
VLGLQEALTVEKLFRPEEVNGLEAAESVQGGNSEQACRRQPRSLQGNQAGGGAELSRQRGSVGGRRNLRGGGGGSLGEAGTFM